MSLDFIVIGIFFIWSLFYLNLQKHTNIILVIVQFLFLLGYFIGNITIKNITINIINIFSVSLLGVVLCRGVKANIRNCIYASMATFLIYVLINYIYLDFNIYFSILPFTILLIVVNFINELAVNESVVSSILSIVFAEIFNVFFLIKEIKYMALFQSNLILCIAISVGVIWVLTIIKNKLWRIKNEKIC